MNLMPPANWTEFAMKSDIADLKIDIADLRSEIADRYGQLLRTFGTWLFVSQAGVIAAVTLAHRAHGLIGRCSMPAAPGDRSPAPMAVSEADRAKIRRPRPRSPTARPTTAAHRSSVANSSP